MKHTLNYKAMKQGDLFKTKKFNSEIVPYPMSRFEDGHISITEGETRTPICMLPFPVGGHKAGVERQKANAEMIRRLPDFVDVAIDVLVSKQITEADLNRFKKRIKKLLTYKEV